MTDRSQPTMTVLGLLALAGWAFAAISSVMQKLNADRQIAHSFDISAIQVQQLNGSVTAHILMCLVIGCACTVPLLVYVAVRVVLGPPTADEVAPVEEPVARSGKNPTVMVDVADD